MANTVNFSYLILDEMIYGIDPMSLDSCCEYSRKYIVVHLIVMRHPAVPKAFGSVTGLSALLRYPGVDSSHSL
jgi:hypothetical protein